MTEKSPWDSRIFAPFFILLFYEGVSGLYLYLSTAFTVPRQFTILSHILLGFLLLPLVFLHQPAHLVRSFSSPKRLSKTLGYIGCLAVIIASVTGVVWTLVGVRTDNYQLTQGHLITGVAALVTPLVHMGFMGQMGFMKVLRLPACLVFGFITVGVVAYLSMSYKPVEYKNGPPADYDYKFGKNPFHPSETMTSTGDIIDARIMGNSRSCGTSGCHKEIYEQWYASAHRWSSTDIFYRRTEEYMIKKEGMVADRYCGGCHDPIALLSGAINPGQSLDSPHSEEGISCIVCHSITQIRHLRGSGSYLFTPPERYIYEGMNGALPELLNTLVIRSDPSLHKRVYSKDFYSKPEYCAVCHKQFIGKDTNHWGWLKLQDQYGSWLASRFSGRNSKGFSSDREVKTCNDCHMPLEKADDPAARPGGGVRSHRYIAANPAIPWLSGDKVQFEKTVEWLKRREIFLDIYEPRVKDGARGEKFVSRDIYGAAEIAPYVYIGDRLELHVSATNVNVAHHFPDGPIDVHEVWIEVRITDSQGALVFHSGDMDKDGNVDETAHFYRALGVDRFGKLIDKHNLWDMVGNVYAKTIPPGETDIATYQFEVPYWTKGDLTVMARLRYRKFNQWYTNWALERTDVRLPIVDMARDTMTIPVKKRRPAERTVRSEE